jgi:phosphomannomutase
VDLGILPTPTIQIYTAATRARGGLAITASHNPPEYNALKLFNGEGLFFNQYEREELLDLYHQRDFRQATNAEMQGGGCCAMRIKTGFAHGAFAWPSTR